MEDIAGYIFILLLFGGGGIGTFVHTQLERGRKAKLALAAERRKTAEAEATREREKNIAKALEVRKDELALERFDREHGGAARALTSSAVPDEDERTIRKLIDEGTERVRDREQG